MTDFMLMKISKDFDDLREENKILKEKIEAFEKSRKRPSILFNDLIECEKEQVEEHFKRQKMVCEWFDGQKFCENHASNLLPRPQIIVCEKHRDEFIEKAKEIKEKL